MASRRFRTHSSRSRGPRRRLVWSESQSAGGIVAGATTFNQNLMTDVDTKLGIFVNKGFSVRRIVGDIFVYRNVVATVNQIVTVGFLAGDPNLPLPNLSAGNTDLRKLWQTNFFMLNQPAAAQTLGNLAYPTPPQHVDTEVRYTFPDEREDLWISTSNQGADQIIVMYKIRVLLAMP